MSKSNLPTNLSHFGPLFYAINKVLEKSHTKNKLKKGKGINLQGNFQKIFCNLLPINKSRGSVRMGSTPCWHHGHFVVKSEI